MIGIIKKNPQDYFTKNISWLARCFWQKFNGEGIVFIFTGSCPTVSRKLLQWMGKNNWIWINILCVCRQVFKFCVFINAYFFQNDRTVRLSATWGIGTCKMLPFLTLMISQIFFFCLNGWELDKQLLLKSKEILVKTLRGGKAISAGKLDCVFI